MRIMTLMFLVLATSACTNTAGPRPMMSIPMQTAVPDDPTAAWRRCIFRVSWPEDAEPDWAMDLLIAHRIIGPVLAGQGGDIYRWRFHRRANRDPGSHQFSFIYYTGSTQAERIIHGIETNALRQRLLDEGYLETAGCDSADDTRLTGITDTSDPNWSGSMQRNWPAYIMGISTLWLGLIDDAVNPGQMNPADTGSLIQAYRRANEQITETWQEEGQHALLHHMTAIFGYEELLIRY